MNNLNNTDLEAQVLSEIVFDWQIWSEIAHKFDLSIFIHPDHINIAQTIITLKNDSKQADLVTLSAEMKKRELFHQGFGIVDLALLVGRAVGASSVDYHLTILQELHMKREVKRLAEVTIQDVNSINSDIFDTIDRYEKGLTELTNKVIQVKESTTAELYKEAISINEKIVKMNGNLSGVTSGFKVIDEITGGWQPSDLIILAASAGAGKSSLALSFLKNPSLLGIPTAFFSMEMSNRQLFARMLSQESYLDLTKILRTGLSEWDLKVLEESTKKLREAPMYFDDSNMSVYELKNKARKLKRKHGIKLLVIDYLQLIGMGKDKKGNRTEEVSYISRSLKGLAKELNIPIIAISSLSKEVDKRQGKVPQKSDLRESGNIEFDADLICFLYRPESVGILVDDEGNSTAGKCFFMIEKHRNGSLGSPRIGFEGSQTRFYEI